MDPADFITLAIKLSSSRGEAELRSAVSRAYYGAFHLARKLVEDCGVRLPRKELYAAEVHKKVRFCLSQERFSDAAIAANRLSSLRDLRNDADYDLGTDKFSKSSNAIRAIDVARQIVDSLQRCRNEPSFSELRENVRAYARTILRLPVDEN